jgi:acyl-CoA reductase-like NAD-dependent aldehyde dehydrogenase
METTMTTKTFASQSGFSRPLTATVIGICAALAMGAAVALAPSAATPAATNMGAFAGPTSYLPDEIAGQYKPVEDVYFYE